MIHRLLALAWRTVLQTDPAPTPTAAPVTASLEPLLHEVAALRDVLAGSGLLLPLAVVLLAWVLAAGAARLLRLARRTGYGGRRPWFARVQVAVTAALALWALALLARILLARAPLLSLVLAVVFVGGALLSLALRLPQVAGGLLLVVRGRVSEGDRVSVGGVEGTVERVGLIRLQLRRADGSAVYLPTSLLHGQPLTVAHRERSRALEVHLERTQPFTAADREAARRTALLCPFRVLGSAVEVRSPDRRPTALVVRLQVWGEAALRDAELLLRRALEAPPTG